MELLLDHSDLGVGVGATHARDGDVHPTRVPAPVLSARQRSLTGHRWAMGAQVHGTSVWHADGVRPADQLVAADIVVLERPTTADAPSALAMWAADCATAVFVGERTLIGVHAGWRGLAQGVVQRAAETAGSIEAVVVGPMIGPCCYEFSEHDLDVVAAGVHAGPDAIRSVTAAGAPALDVPAAMRAALADVGHAPDAVADGCTGCGDGGRRWFSHRARVDAGRHALVGWFHD